MTASGSGSSRPPNADEAALTLAALIDGLAVQVTLSDSTITRNFMRELCIEAADRLLGADLRSAAAEPAAA